MRRHAQVWSHASSVVFRRDEDSDCLKAEFRTRSILSEGLHGGNRTQTIRLL